MAKQIWVAVFVVTFAWSAIEPMDRFTWLLEVLPAIIGFIVVWLTYDRFRLTPLTYCLILIHCVILMIGGHYTYAEVPIFDEFRDMFGWERNNYDKVGHFAQGFIPAIIAREIVIRKKVINGRRWQNFFVVCFCLGFSAFYELIEWWVAVASGEGADAFLGTQGYVWDTQSDMGFALLGAIASLALLAKLHDRQLRDVGA